LSLFGLTPAELEGIKVLKNLKKKKKKKKKKKIDQKKKIFTDGL